MRNLAFLASVVILFVSVSAVSAQEASFRLDSTSGVSFSTNPGSFEDPVDDLYFLETLSGSAKLALKDGYSLSVIGITRSSRFESLELDTDTTVGTIIAAKSWGNTSLSLTGSFTSDYEPFFDEKRYGLFDAGARLSHKFTLAKGFDLTPGITFINRSSDVTVLERKQIDPSLTLDASLLGGTMKLRAAFSYRDYDSIPRTDRNFAVSASFSRTLLENAKGLNLDASLGASYAINESDGGTDYRSLTIGPTINVYYKYEK